MQSDIIKRIFISLYKCNLNPFLPMTYFTPEELNPSEQVLNTIRQIAYSYQAYKSGGEETELLLN